MKNKILATIFVMLIAGASFVFADAAQAQAQCQNTGAPVIVHIDQSSLRVTPHCKVIYSQVFLIEIMNHTNSGYDLQTGRVCVEEKQPTGDPPPNYIVKGCNDIDPTWLVATIEPRNEGDPEPSGIIGYDVKVADHGSLDPRVEISGSRPASSQVQAMLERYALSLGLAVQLVVEEVRPAIPPESQEAQ